MPEQIVQTSPCHCTALRKAARHLSQIYDRCLRASDLRSTQFSLLAELTRRTKNPPTMGELAECLVMDRSTLGHNLRPLERRGLIALKIDQGDQRTRRVLLTAQGAAKFSEARKLWLEAQERYERSIGHKQAAGLRETLSRIAGLQLE